MKKQLFPRCCVVCEAAITSHRHTHHQRCAQWARCWDALRIGGASLGRDREHDFTELEAIRKKLLKRHKVAEDYQAISQALKEFREAYARP